MGTEDVLTALEWLPPPEVKAGWHVLEATAEDGVARPYHLYVPELATEVDSDALPPLLVDMHGGVSRPEFITAAQFERFRDTWTELADEHGFVVAMPLGRADCMWWTDTGVGHVLAVVRDVARHVDYDRERVVATGFSDGGSGCFYLAMAGHGPFAALMPMNGHPMVAVSASGRQLYLRNAAGIPLFVCMTQDDGLYPAQTVLPHVQRLIENGASVHLVSYPTGGHTPSYFEDQSGAFVRFLQRTVRDSLPEQFEWAAAHSETARVHWAEIAEFGAGDGDVPAADVPDVQVMSVPGRIRLGVGIDREFAGPGVRVTSVREDHPAADLGIQVGDVLRRVDETEIETLADLRAVLGAKTYGDEISVEILREGDAGGERILASTRLPEFEPSPQYGRERPTAWLRLAQSGSVVRVESHGVRALRLHLSEDAFDLSQPVTVIVNGIERARETVKPDVERLVRGWAARADRGRLYSAVLDVTIPAPESPK